MAGYGSIGSTPLASDTHNPDHSTPNSPDVVIDRALSTEETPRRSTSITICGTIDDRGRRDSRYNRARSDVESQANDSFVDDEGILSNQHCHVSTSGTPKLDRVARCKLITASVLCLVFMTAEIVGGILANSLAVATDAAHLLTDFASFMISLFAIYLASRPATKSMSFGWHRAEVMGALISVLFIWVVTGILVYMAAERVMSGQYEIDATIMLIIASIGIAFNIVMLATLHDTHGHSHGHAHSHSVDEQSIDNQEQQKFENSCHSHSHGNYSNTSNGSASPETNVVYNNQHPEEVKLLGSSDSLESASSSRGTNINVRAAFIHVLGDLIQSAGVLIAALIIYFKPEYKLADPICTFLFSVLVLITTITILRDTLNVLMEGTPRGVSFSEVKERLTNIPGVLELHNLRLWSLTTSRTAVAVHLAVAKDSDHQHISRKAGALLRDRFGIHECTIQTEQFVDEMRDCTQCQDPQD